MKLTTEEVKKAVRAKFGMSFIPDHPCGICGVDVGYHQHGDDVLIFDPKCGCGPGFGPRETDFTDIAATINMQKHPDAIASIKTRFGLDK